jgi:hypothetical protein
VCDVPLFPACKLAPNATEMHCGENMPRSCECFRQCRRFYCGGGKGACETPRDPWYVRCFERPQPAPGSGTPKPAMFSDVPEEWEETKGLMSWHLGIRSDLQRQKLTRQQATKVGASERSNTLQGSYGLSRRQCSSRRVSRCHHTRQD